MCRSGDLIQPFLDVHALTPLMLYSGNIGNSMYEIVASGTDL